MRAPVYVAKRYSRPCCQKPAMKPGKLVVSQGMIAADATSEVCGVVK